MTARAEVGADRSLTGFASVKAQERPHLFALRDPTRQEVQLDTAQIRQAGADLLLLAAPPPTICGIVETLPVSEILTSAVRGWGLVPDDGP